MWYCLLHCTNDGLSGYKVQPLSRDVALFYWTVTY